MLCDESVSQNLLNFFSKIFSTVIQMQCTNESQEWNSAAYFIGVLS